MVTTQQKEIDDLKNRLLHIEKILIIGDGERLPLAEIVRSLTKTVGDYIAQKDKEEQNQREKFEKEESMKKAEWNKAKWLIISIATPLIFTFIGQAFIFYFRVLPIIETVGK
jgi:hypothetical protein